MGAAEGRGVLGSSRGREWGAQNRMGADPAGVPAPGQSLRVCAAENGLMPSLPRHNLRSEMSQEHRKGRAAAEQGRGWDARRMGGCSPGLMARRSWCKSLPGQGMGRRGESSGVQKGARRGWSAACDVGTNFLQSLLGKDMGRWF